MREGRSELSAQLIRNLSGLFDRAQGMCWVWRRVIGNMKSLSDRCLDKFDPSQVKISEANITSPYRYIKWSLSSDRNITLFLNPDAYCCNSQIVWWWVPGKFLISLVSIYPDLFLSKSVVHCWKKGGILLLTFFIGPKSDTPIIALTYSWLIPV